MGYFQKGKKKKDDLRFLADVNGCFSFFGSDCAENPPESHRLVRSG